MPIYDMECPRCGLVKDVWAKIDEQIMRHSCGTLMHRVLSASNIRCDLEPYFDENLSQAHGKGNYVTSRQHRKELMKRLGLVEAG